MKILKLVFPLTLIAAVCAAVLAVVNTVTKGPIENIKTLKENSSARVVLPAGVKAIDVRADPADAAIKIFVGYADDARKQIVGYAVPGLNGSGYGGDIRLMVGLTPNRTVISYRVLAANETPGLGAKLGDAAFADQFAGKPGAALKVKKDGGAIDAITGATITSRAVCAAISDACARVDRLEGKASAAPAPAPKAAIEGKLILDPTQSATALKVLPKSTTKTEAVTTDRFPIFEGQDAAGNVTGYAVVGTGRGKGPEGEIVVHYLYGFTARGAISRTARPLPVNQLDITAVDMIAAQTTAINAALQDAQGKIRKILEGK